MANLPETSTFEAGIYRIETSDQVVGGPEGISNLQGKQLANRTRYLKDHVDAIEAGVANGNLYPDGSIRRAKLANGALTAFVRASILSGPVSGSTGRPSHISGTVGTTTININGAPTPITLAFSDGYDAKGPVDYIHQITADTTVSISGVGGTSSDVIVYARRNSSTGAVTLEVSNEAIVYSNTSPTPGGGFWFDAVEQRWFQWSALGGGSWVPVQMVLLAKVRRSSGNIALVIPSNYQEDPSGNRGVLPGSVIAMRYDVSAPPVGYLACNGASLLKSSYARLFDVIGGVYGETSTNFSLPNIAALTTGMNYFIKL